MNKNHEAYEKVVIRLSEYRNNCKLTQQQMGEYLDVTQSHYSKLEAGTKIISRNSLMHFQNNGGDVQWLITGNKKQDGLFDHYFNLCPDDQSKSAFLEAALWIIEQGLRIKNSSDINKLDYVHKNLRVLLLKDSAYSLWEKIRAVEGLTQLQMSYILDINIKRYRRLEKELNEVDAEVLSSLYVNLGYSPMIMMQQKIYCISELNAVWKEFNVNLQERLLPYVIKDFELINLECEEDGKKCFNLGR